MAVDGAEHGEASDAGREPRGIDDELRLGLQPCGTGHGGLPSERAADLVRRLSNLGPVFDWYKSIRIDMSIGKFDLPGSTAAAAYIDVRQSR
jgi:hypothetical protein